MLFCLLLFDLLFLLFQILLHRRLQLWQITQQLFLIQRMYVLLNVDIILSQHLLHLLPSQFHHINMVLFILIIIILLPILTVHRLVVYHLL